MSNDDHHTGPEAIKLAGHFVNSNRAFDDADGIVDPSAGNGAFGSLIPKSMKRWESDINPGKIGIKKHDMMNLKDILIGFAKRLIIMTNPPYSKIRKFLLYFASIPNVTRMILLIPEQYYWNPPLGLIEKGFYPRRERLDVPNYMFYHPHDPKKKHPEIYMSLVIFERSYRPFFNDKWPIEIVEPNLCEFLLDIRHNVKDRCIYPEINEKDGASEFKYDRACRPVGIVRKPHRVNTVDFERIVLETHEEHKKVFGKYPTDYNIRGQFICHLGRYNRRRRH